LLKPQPDIDPSAEISRGVNQQAMRLLQSHLHEFAANNISKLLANVVAAFSKKERLPGWARSAEEKQWR
jgi:hypothetical protein